MANKDRVIEVTGGQVVTLRGAQVFVSADEDTSVVQALLAKK